MCGTTNGLQILVTGRSKLSSISAGSNLNLPPVESGLECLVFLDGAFAALFGFEDSPRANSRVFVSDLSPRHQVTKVILVFGDRKRVAAPFGALRDF